MSVQLELSITICAKDESKKNLIDHIIAIKKKIDELHREIEIIKRHELKLVDVEELDKELDKSRNELIESIKSLMNVETVRKIRIFSISSPCKE